MAKKSKKAKTKEAKKKAYHRAHLIKNFITSTKLVEVQKTYKYFRQAEALIAKDQWRLLHQGNIPFSLNRGDLPHSLKYPLIERYLRDAEHQTVGTLQSFLSNLENEFRRVVIAFPFQEETKHQLLMINCWQAWYYRPSEDVKEPDYFKITNQRILLIKKQEAKEEKVKAEGKTLEPTEIPYLQYPKETFTLARLLMRRLLKKNWQPSYDHSNMRLSANVAEITPKLAAASLPPKHRGKNNRPCKGCKKCKPAKSFDFWVKFSTTNPGHPIYLPLQDSTYRQQQGGKLCQSLQFNFTNLGELQIAVIQQKPLFKYLPAEEQKALLERDLGGTLSGSINLDTGLVVGLATNKGDLHGLSFFESLKAYDARMLPLVRHLNKNKIPLKSNKKYLHLVRDTKSYIKNELNRIINRIVKIHLPSRIIIDQLDFRGSHLSRQMNRILRNCGLGVIRKKLESLTEEYGIEIVYVNPAYTSKECNHCGYIDKRNRQGRDFKCLLCGYTIHADVGGARNHEARSSLSYPFAITLDTSVNVVLKSLTRRFLDQLKTLHWLQRLRSKAKVLILSNPYFKDYWDDVAKGLVVV